MPCGLHAGLARDIAIFIYLSNLPHVPVTLSKLLEAEFGAETGSFMFWEICGVKFTQ